LDRLDRLTERLAQDLDRQANLPPSGSHPELRLLEHLATGTLDSQARERVDAHLDTCLECLNRFVELRDYLQGIAEPAQPSSRLARHLDRLTGTAPRTGLGTRVVESLRRALIFRIPAWAVAGAAAAMLVTWASAYKLQGPGTGVEWPFADPSGSGRLKPAHSETTHTITGVVSSTRNVTSNGVEAHVVSLKDASGATYTLFAWGRPTVSPGDTVEIDGILTGATESAGVSVQSTSPMFARNSYWCIIRTIEAAGFVVKPYYTAVPSFGLWGYALARSSSFDVPHNPPPGLKFLDEQTLAAMFTLSKDIEPVPVEINRLDNQVLVRYYEGEWRKFE